MITEKDLQEAIAECQGQRYPNANTCIKLAAFLTIQRELFGHSTDQDSQLVMDGELNSFSPPPEQGGTTVGNYGDSDFLLVVENKNAQSVFLVMDELMDAMQVLQPRIYDSVMRKLQHL